MYLDSIGASREQTWKTQKLSQASSGSIRKAKGSSIYQIPVQIDSVDLVPTSLLKSSDVTTEMKYPTSLLSRYLNSRSLLLAVTGSILRERYSQLGVWQSLLLQWICAVPDLIRLVAVLFG
jgi:hypothetical protein